MRYKNKNTGAVIDTVVGIQGGGWEEIPCELPVRKAEPAPETAPEEPPKKKTRRKRTVKQ